MSGHKEILLPVDVRIGMIGGPAFLTEIVEKNSGHEQRNIGMATPLRSYRVEYVRGLDTLKTLHAFFLAVRGAAYSFRVRDWLDYIVASTEGLLGAGIGTGYPTYQLYKRYTFGSETFDRAITKIVSGSATLYRNAIALDAGSPTVYSLDVDTGIATFTPDDTEAITGHTVGASHQFTTTADIAGLGIGDKVYITGVTGTAASLLNSLAHTISNKSGSGPYTWTLSTSTGGSPTLTASGGTAYAYPQSDDILSWAGQFDTPCRFTADQFNVRTIGANLFEVDALGLKEVRL